MEAESIEYERGLTFEKVWATIQELAKAADRRSEETDRKFRETDRKFREVAEEQKETARQIQEMKQSLGGIGHSLGELVEHLMTAELTDKFHDFGYVFTKASPRVKYRDSNRQILAEVDMLLENGDCVMAVEVKTALIIEDIKDHGKQLEILRSYADAHQDHRVYHGAVAGGIISKEVREYALKTGFYVIEPSGDTAIIKAPDKVKTWR